MAFVSILFPDGAAGAAPTAQPACLPDLNLDRAIETILDGYREYDLRPYFHLPLATVETIAYRQDVMRDLEDARIMGVVQEFARRMRTTRARVARAAKSYYLRERHRWHLDAVAEYCAAVEAFAAALRDAQLGSRGLRELREHLADHVRGAPFVELSGVARRLSAELASIRYTLLIHEGSVTIRAYDAQKDYTIDVEATFAKFRHGQAEDYRVAYDHDGGMTHVDAAIVDRVALLFPNIFRALEVFVAEHGSFIDATIALVDREVHFYVAYLACIQRLRKAGLEFCYPRVEPDSKVVDCRGAFDLALAQKLVAARSPVIPNDVALAGAERLLVVTGPNQGGKTTFARMFGQLHYLASLGCAVPGTSARVILFDEIFTHFEREEDLSKLRGKLQDDLVRVHEILQRATSRSIVIMNEIFSSTSLTDAVYLSRKIMTRLGRLAVVGVWVTFLAELASFDEGTVSIVSTIDPRDPTVRTFKLERRDASSASYGLLLAEKHRVTYERLKERLTR